MILTGIVFALLVGQNIQQRDLSVVRMGSAAELSKAVAVPRGYAVVIGISSYANLGKDFQLPFAEKDAENVYSTLIAKEAGNMEFQNVVKILGADATREKIQDTLERWLPEHAQPEDRVIVYFAGHGVVDEAGRGYLATHNLKLDDVAATGYSMESLGEALSKRVKAKWKLLLIDACHSGKVTVSTSNEKINNTLRDLPQGFLTLTSSRAGQRSFEDPGLAGGNGIFSYFLVQGWLGQADADPRDGIVSADELIDYVRREVRDYVKKRGGQQVPQESGDFQDEMLLGFSPVRRQQLLSSLGEVANGNLVIEVNLSDVEISIDGNRMGVASPTQPLRVPGLSSGKHEVRGARMGYDPATVEVNLAPGATSTVSIRLVNPRPVKPAAKANFDEAEKIWIRSKSTVADLRKAGELYSAALKEDKSFGRAALGLCRVQRAEGRTDEALKSCEKAVSIDTDFQEARLQYGGVLMDSGDYQEAVRQLQRCASQDASNPSVRVLLAEALFWADRPKEAEAEAARAIELDGAAAQAYFLRAESRRLLGKSAEARGDYRKALQLQDFGSSALRKVAFYAIGHGMQKNRSGKQVLYRNQVAASYFGICACDLAETDYDQGLRNCRKALSVDASDADSYMLLGEIYTRMFNDENRRDHLVKAKENLESALRINPNHARAPEMRQKIVQVRELLPMVR